MSTLVSAKDFFSHLQDPGELVAFENCVIRDFIVIENQQDFNCSGLFFKNVEFRSSIVLKDIHLGAGIAFVNCQIAGILISNCTALWSEKMREFDTQSFLLEGSIIQDLRIFSSSLPRGIRIVDMRASIPILEIMSLKANEGSIQIENSQIMQTVDINNTFCHNGIRIHKAIIDCPARFENNSGSSISLTKAIFNKDLRIWAGQLDYLSINDGEYKDEVVIDCVDCSGYLTVSGGTFERLFKILYFDPASNRHKGIKKIYLKSCSFNEGFEATDGIDDSKFILEVVEIHSSKTLTGDIKFNALETRRICLFGTLQNASLHFENIKTTTLEFYSFINYSTLQFSDFRASDTNESLLQIEQSNIGKAHFLNVSLLGFQSVVVDGSILINIVCANVQWFEERSFYLPVSTSNAIIIEYWKNRKEVYRQLKYAMETQGNRVQALYFKQQEMLAFNNELRSRTISTWDWNYINNKMIMWFNKSNSYGQNWIRPIILLLFTTFTFYALITINHYDIRLNTCSDWANYISLLTINSGKGIQLIDPTHSINRILEIEISHKSVSNTIYFLDFIYKIILAYFLFQTISAFRKYIK